MGSPGRVHWGPSADPMSSAPLPPCLLDVRRPLEQNKPVNRGSDLDDRMCPENQCRRAPVIVKPPRESSPPPGPPGACCVRRSGGPLPVGAGPRQKSQGRSEGFTHRTLASGRRFSDPGLREGAGPRVRLVWTGAPNTSHQQLRHGKTRGQSSALQSHSFTYTENSSNLFQNCLVSS